MNPRLVRLFGHDYRSFVAPFEVQFPETGLLALNALNRDTGGSSGAGKSNLLNALACLLGFSPLPATEMGSWFSDKPYFLGAEIKTAQGALIITRGKTLTVSLDGVDVPGSASQKEAKVKSVLGLDPDMLKALTYRRQGQPGLFLSKTDAEKKEFLTSLLDLERFEVAAQTATDKLNGFLAQEAKAQQTVSVYDAQLAQYADLAPLEAVQKVVAEAAALVVLAETEEQQAKHEVTAAEERGKQAVKNAGNDLVLALAMAKQDLVEVGEFRFVPETGPADKVQGVIAVCNNRLQAMCQQDDLDSKAARAARDQILHETVQAKAKLATKPTLFRDAQRLKTEIAKLTADQCPTCLRAWDAAAEKKAELEWTLDRVTEQLDAFPGLEQAVVGLEAKLAATPPHTPNPAINDLRTKVSDLKAEAAGLQQQAREAEKLALAQYNEKTAVQRAAVSALEGQIKTAKLAATEVAKNELDAFRLVVTEAHQKWSLLAGNLSLQRGKLALLEGQYATKARLEADKARDVSELERTGALVATEKDFLALIGREGFLGSIFDEVLEEVSDETNAILLGVANTRHCSVAFQSEKVTKTETIQRKITLVVNVGGVETTFVAGLSGGMQRVVELAVDLAVGAVISRRTGACPGWLVLDEVLWGLGPVEQESALEMLQNHAADRLILIVDHSSEAKALCTQQILVEFSDGKSTVKGPL